MQQKLLDVTCTESELTAVAVQIVNHLGTQPFTLWLLGPLGAGKTTLTRAILRTLGLPEQVPVRSPTYTIMNEVKIGKQWYAHLDLYRLPTQANLHDLGLAGGREFSGIFVEWPENVADNSSIMPTHRLMIEISSEDRRRIVLEGVE